MPLRVPPKCEGTCFIHWNGVDPPRPRPPGNGSRVAGRRSRRSFASCRSTVSGMPLWVIMLLSVPVRPPSALAPLSPTM